MRQNEFIREVCEAASSDRSLAAGAREFALDSSAFEKCHARLEGGWLHLSVDPATKVAPEWQDLEFLRLNPRLRGHARFARRLAGGPVSIKAEVPVDTESDLAGRVRETCAGLTEALLVFEERGWGEEISIQPESRDELGFSEDQAGLLARLCQEAGWEARARASGTVTVDLRGPRGMPMQALIVPAGSDSVRVSIELLSLDGLSSVSRKAVGKFLMAASGAMRMARPVTTLRGQEVSVRLEVVLGKAPTAVEVTHALSSLSVAASICCREVRALAREDLAQKYLDLLAERPENLEVQT